MNAVWCAHCGAVIESLHVHDFRWCDCPEETRVAVDGGHEYCRRVFGSRSEWVEVGTWSYLVAGIRVLEEEDVGSGR